MDYTKICLAFSGGNQISKYVPPPKGIGSYTKGDGDYFFVRIPLALANAGDKYSTCPLLIMS